MASRRSPRAVRDKALQEPYRSWIDRSKPLPASVRLLPRTVNVVFDLLIFLMLGGMFAGMAGLIAFLPPWLAAGARWGLIFIGLIVFGLLLVPLVLFRRFYRTFWAALDQKRGVLRQGIFIGRDGLLVRIEPNHCFPIAAERFIEAKLRVSGGPSDNESVEKELFCLETLDGPIEFFSERLSGSPGNVNSTFRSLRPGK